MKRLLREPLLYFLLAGGLLFALDALLNERRTEPEERDIVVSEGRIENLAAVFAKTWQRPPTRQELQRLVDEWVREEALYREAKTMGLDRDDTIVRRRMRQKMEFVVNDIVEQVAPSESELEQWLKEHPDTYALPDRYRFQQVFLNAKRRGAAAKRDAERLLAKLRRGRSDPREVGDASLLAPAYPDLPADAVDRTFGDGFAERLAKLPVGEWAGPIESPFGMHLVIVDRRTKGRVPALAEVRGAVERDLRFQRREAASERFYEEAVARYRVTVDWPESMTEPPDQPMRNEP